MSYSQDFILHNDVSLSESNLIETHNEQISSGEASKATATLDTNNISSGLRASVINQIESDLLSLETYISSQNHQDDTFYSMTDTLPTTEQMTGKTFWVREKRAADYNSETESLTLMTPFSYSADAETLSFPKYKYDAEQEALIPV